MWVRRVATFFIFGAILATGVLWAEAPEHTSTPSLSSSSETITIGWVGDMVPSGDQDYNENVFASVTSELMKPDLMMGNLEGTFAQVDRSDKCMYLTSMCHAFRGDLSFAASLKDAGFDFVSLVNNHSYDYGKEGLIDTEAILTTAGIPYIAPDKPSTSITVKGKRIGILGLSSTEPVQTIADYDFIVREITTLKEANDYVIVIFHGGAEGSDKTEVPGTTEYVGTENRGDVQKVAYTAIDAGADLVLGSGPHVLRKVEVYHGKPIAYSLGNFVGGKRLVMGGNLSISAIFTSSLGSPSYTLTPITLTSSGIPHPNLDPQETSLLFDDN